MTTLLGFDVGSSSVKVALLDAQSGQLIATATSPKGTELSITAVKAGWAEQDPELWWTHASLAIEEIKKVHATSLAQVEAVGISYQMHGLVVADQSGKPLRPSIIWCDSRAVEIGERAFKNLGEVQCLRSLLNSPGNFTASKLRWVMEHEPEVIGRISKFMLPGDYLASRITGEICTTPSGLSEGILWDYLQDEPSKMLLSHYEIDERKIPHIAQTFSVQGKVKKDIAKQFGIPETAVVSYRAGDQPNNAFSLGVLEPGEFATTAGTSGVIYGIGDKPSFDSKSRVNTFLHINHTKQAPRYGTLLCCNGTGISYRWLKQLAGTNSYNALNEKAKQISAGAQGLQFFPYGNGAERSLGNANLGASVEGLNFNIHSESHMARAVLEGIVFSLRYGIDIMAEMGISLKTVRAGEANLFLSPTFREIFSATLGANVELYSTDGAQGAARGAGIGAAVFASPRSAFHGLSKKAHIEPSNSLRNQYEELYQGWKSRLQQKL